MTDINDRILRQRRNHLASKPNRTRAEEAELNTISAELDAADALLRLTDTRAEYRTGEQSEPQTITINRTFADGSTLTLTINGDEARHFYYRYLFPLLKRDGD